MRATERQHDRLAIGDDDPDDGPELIMLEPEEEAENEKRAQTALSEIGAGLLKRFNDYERDRIPIEARWLEDLRQFHGEYDPADLAAIKEAGGTQLFVNVTRKKVNTYAARMAEMLLPTDGKNFGIDPTPVPQLAQALNDKLKPAIDPATGQPMMGDNGQPVTNADFAKAVKEVAKERADAMEAEIDDQLTESSYNAVTRLAIDQMAQLGTGIAKGPVLTDKKSVSWQKITSPDGTILYKRIESDNPRPAIQFVDCWNLYPDMSASTPDGWEGVFEQFLVNKREFRKIAKENGFRPEAVEMVLASEPTRITNIYWLAEMRALNGLTNFTDARYRLLQYHGELDAETLKAAGIDVKALGEMDAYYGVVWFCDSIVLKVSLSPLDSGAHPYSLAYCERDTNGPFGYGIPRLMRGEQRAANASYRMMHDNSGLSVGPMIVMNSKKVSPRDGDPRFAPRKIWDVNDDSVKVGDVFGKFEIESHQQELMNLFSLNERLADDATMTPLIAQGDQAPHITKTARGMTILFNAANVVLRRSVKFFDDYYTVPLISRFYEWNMQFNEREDIKGDFRVMARGSSVLLEREQEAEQAAMALNFGLDPRVTAHLDIHKLIEAVYKGWQLENVVRDPDDYEAERARIDKENQTQLQLLQEQKEAAKRQEKEAANDPFAERKVAVLEDKNRIAREKHADEVQLTLMEYALEHNLTIEEARKELARERIKQDAENMRFNAEAKIKAQAGSGL